VPIRILIADDHAIFRSGLRELLRADSDLEVVGEAGDGAETLRLAAALSPDLVLLDITMPEGGGIATARRLKEENPELAVVFLTMHEDESLLSEALRAGAAGYVIKRAEAFELLQAIQAASRGDIYVHPAMTRALLRQPVTTQHRRGTPAPALTPRELDVLRLLVRGNTNRQIADLLGLSPRTIESHRAI
jgi:two-component system, NarL family, response regulator NreC